MSRDKSNTYETKSDADTIEDLSKRLTEDLRKSIRALGSHTILSPKWCEMADSVHRIGNIAQMEQKVRRVRNGCSRQGVADFQ